jgi:peptide/nickel transport system substrate-binding protein
MTSHRNRLAPTIQRWVAAGACAALLLSASAASAQVPALGTPRPGGTVRIASMLEPQILNPYFIAGIPDRLAAGMPLEGLARGGPDGTYLPALAAEIPTQANGGVSADGTVVTWKLKQNVLWSDGEPFTSRDVLFTYHMIRDPSNPVLNRTDYLPMDSVTAPDESTVVVTYKQLYAPYRSAFQWILPAHVFGGATDISQSAFNHAPTVGTGSFVFSSWTSGDTLVFDRNQRYREPGKPYLDQVILKITPSKDAELQALRAGDVDVAFQLDETYLPQLDGATDIRVDAVPASNVVKLILNQSCSSGPRAGDASCSHPLLGDGRVRQAFALAIDKQAIVHNLLADRTPEATSLIPVGLYPVSLPRAEFNPERARQLLEDAGWRAGSNGVRVKDGQPAHISVLVLAGDNLSAQVQQVVEDDLAAVGIESESRSLPSPVMFGGFVGNSPLPLGTFDLALFATPYQLDPQAFLFGNFASSQLPNPTLRTGQNYTRTQNPLLDQALTDAASTLDDQARLAAYTRASELINADAAYIPLYPHLQVNPRSARIGGWHENVNDYLSWNIQEWWLDR